jgi:hypothetical protein
MILPSCEESRRGSSFTAMLRRPRKRIPLTAGQLWLGRAVPRKDAIPRAVFELLNHILGDARIAGMGQLAKLVSANEALYPAAVLILNRLRSDVDNTVRLVAANVLERLEAEEREQKERLDAQRCEREQKERQEPERGETEAKERLDAEGRQKEEQERLEAERREREGLLTLQHRRSHLVARLSFVPFVLLLVSWLLPFWGNNLLGYQFLWALVQYWLRPYPAQLTDHLILLSAFLCTIFVLSSHFLKYRWKAVLEVVVSWLCFDLLATFIFYPLENIPNARIGLILACIFAAAGAVMKTFLLTQRRKLTEI